MSNEKSEITINLKELGELFDESASDTDLPKPVRVFASRLRVLIAHVERIDSNLMQLARNAQLADKTLAGRIVGLRDQLKTLTEAPAAPAATEAATPAATPAAVPAEVPAAVPTKPGDEKKAAESEAPDSEEAAIEKFLAESAAEERAAIVANKKAEAESRRNKKNIVPIKAEAMPAAAEPGKSAS